jgi:hypothetical protein
VKIMNKLILILIFSLVGAGIPITWLLFWNWAKSHCEQCVSWFMGLPFFDVTLLALWPSSLLLIADPSDNNVQLQAISVLVNIVFYMILGWLTYLALYRTWLFFIPIFGFYICWLWFVA